MRGNNMLGILFSNSHDDKLRELTEIRAMGSVPFGGRYRMIDFPLSNMVNSGINKVGVITKYNYQSLMDHLGSGKAWDLSRKREGLFMLPPFGNVSSMQNSRVESLASIENFLKNSKEEFVVLSDCDTICNIDYTEVMAYHLDKGADVTVIYRYGDIPQGFSNPTVYTVDPEGRVRDMVISPNTEGPCNYGMTMCLIRRELLMQLVADCVSRNLYNFKRDLLQRHLRDFKFYGYEFTGVVKTICSMNSYFEANMSLMLPKIRSELFNPERPIYTKVRDDMPARYGLGSSVSNSIIADGCVVEGTVENCVLFRGVKVGKGTRLENCVIMQDSVIEGGCRLSHVVVDKDVIIREDRSLMGFQSYPVEKDRPSKGAVCLEAWQAGAFKRKLRKPCCFIGP